ncbi:MAG TPA: radical SAM protein, partial [bacterium]|nr:radical SAM protein [bacterium]
YASLWSAHSSKNIKADYFIYGPGENKLLELFSNIFDLNIKIDAPLETVIKYNLPDYSLYDKMISGAVMTSRGCKFNCAYCASKKLFDEYISFPFDLTIKTIDYLVNVKKVSDIAFYDDALLENSENHFIPLLKKILERKFNCRFHLPNAIHIKYITDEIAELLKQTGFDTIRLGFESSDKKWLSDSGYKYKSNEFENAIKSFEKAGLNFSNIAAYVLVGLPEQTKQSLQETISYVKNHSIKLDYAFYSPLPHTKYWEKSVELFPQISGEPLLTNSSVFPVLTDLFFDRRKKCNEYLL